MMRKLKPEILCQRSGETLLEVIIAVGMLMTVMGASGALYIGGVRNTADNREDLVAASLAEEGTEMMRAFRDTNLMRFGFKAPVCWDAKTWDTGVNFDNCDAPTSKIGAGQYILKINPSDFSWTLESTASGLSANLNSPSDVDYRLRLDASIPLYNYNSGDLTNFYREIKIERSGAAPPRNALKVVSRVLYRAGGAAVREMKRGILLTGPPS